MKEAIKFLFPLAAIIVAAFLLYNHFENQTNEVRKDLQIQKDLLMKEDSIREVKVNIVLDSLENLSSRFENEISIQRKENIKLRTQNEKLEKLYRNIDLHDRPDFE